MSHIEIFAMAVALAMDAFAVAVATGLKTRCSLAQTLRMSLAFGCFQFVMPVLGWVLGMTVRGYIEAFDHWVAFALLAFVGVRMIREGLQGAEEAEDCGKARMDPTRGMTLVILAVATSIDALAVGISMAVLQVEVWYPAAIIGLVCFGLTAIGMHVGRVVVREGSKLGDKANVIGGIVLIGIGVKIVIEHLSA